MFCPKCGLQVVGGATICPQCGERLPELATNNPIAAAETMPIVDSGSLQASDSAGPHAATASSVFQMSAPRHKTSRTPIIIVAAAVVICTAGVLAFGLFQGWFSSSPVYVPNEMSVHVSSKNNAQQVEKTQYDRDSNGNLLAGHWIKTGGSSGDDSVDVSYNLDGNGYVTSFSISAPGLQSAYKITFVNDIDDRGRLTATRLQSQDLGSLTAKYSYFGDTDNLESIQYTDFESVLNDGAGLQATSLGNYAVGLTNFLPDSFDPTHNVFTIFIFGYNSYQIRYSENGALQATITNGQETEHRTLEELRGNTFEVGGDSSASWATTSYTYDENGYLTDRVMAAKENAGDINPEWDFDYRHETHISYARISNPSKAVSIFGRLRG